MKNINGAKLLKDGYCIVSLDARHWRRSVKMHRLEDDVEYATQPMHVPYAVSVDGKSISQAQAIKDRKLLTSLLRLCDSKAMSKFLIKSPLSYEQAFEEDYGIRMADVCISDIVEDLMS